MFPVRNRQGVAPGFGTLAVRRLRLPGFCDGGDSFPGYADASDRVVPRHVVGHLSEEWSQRTESATGARVGQLPDSVDVTYLKDHEEKASVLLPRVHRVFGLLKRWLLRTHQGAVQTRHLP